MDIHFRNWSKRSLSLLGKIQIIKTFGLSQYLYSLAVIDFTENQWQHIHKLIFKFLWNKHYNGNSAVHRIKKETMYTELTNGGFGLLNLEEVVKVLRLRRFCILEAGFTHPIATLQKRLGSENFLREKPKFTIDAATRSALKLLHDFNIQELTAYPIANLRTDRIFIQKILRARPYDICQQNRRNSIEMISLRRAGIDSIMNLSNGGLHNINAFLRVCNPRLRNLIRAVTSLPPDFRIIDPDPIKNCHIYLQTINKWQHLILLTSKNIRSLIFTKHVITNTKLANLAPEQAISIYSKLNRINSVQLKTKMLRMLHGDVFCGTKLAKFGLSDRCIRCFSKGTLTHLLFECPFTLEIWQRSQIDIRNKNITDILNPNCTDAQFEIRASLLELILFRTVQMDPNIMIKTTVDRFARGLNKKSNVTRAAINILDYYNVSRQWEF
jgi:hypothetical protein